MLVNINQLIVRAVPLSSNPKPVCPASLLPNFLPCTTKFNLLFKFLIDYLTAHFRTLSLEDQSLCLLSSLHYLRILEQSLECIHAH